jgi:hypothetical protein
MSERYTPLIDFDVVAERRIEEAITRGELDGLPGAGKPLELDDDRLIPAEVRLAHRVLKNAGCVPPEILQRRQIAELEAALPTAATPVERTRALQKLQLLRTRLGVQRCSRLSANARYARKIIEKLGGAES